jgi:ATP-binding cassette subfamily F protein 3
MISVNGVSIHFTGTDLFKNLSFVINEKDRIGLIGKNGVGKSTLLKIIAGVQEATSGGVTIPQSKTIGYLPQEIKLDSDRTIQEEVLTVFEEQITLNKEIEEINEQLEIRTDYESDSYSNLILGLTDKHEQLNLLGADKSEGEVEKILKGLGFKDEDFLKPVSEFSGGWQMRVELAKLLLITPSLLLLDEPTNHLDIESILWLENYFKNYPGALLMISHDRMFLDNVTDRSIEIVNSRIYDYKAAYSKFLELRSERLATQEAAYKNQQKYIADQERFIERFKAKASKAKQAQSKQKQLEKVERIEFDDVDSNAIQFRFPDAPRSGDISVSARDLEKNYGEKHIFDGVDLDIERGEKIAFVGKNGQGKSTMIKMIMGEEDFGGELNIGHNVEIGYYAQVQEKTLDENKTVLATIEDIATGEWAKINKIRGLLGTFLFSGSDVDKRVKVLSGGEKSRLALAKLLLNPVNLLILDEPTNHLDITSKEVLKEALRNYNGTLILVSHDRDFLQGLTNRTFEFADQKVKEHIGDISEFLRKHEIESFRQFETSGKKETPKKEKKESGNKPVFVNKKDYEKEVRQIRSDVGKSEKKIENLELDISIFEEDLQTPEKYDEKMADKAAFAEYEKDKSKLEREMLSWENLQEKLANLESKK